jgi:hypothetical protein
MTAAASPVLARPGERFARRVVTGCAVLVVAACFGFSFGNVLALGRQLAVPAYVAWLIAPAVDLTVVGLIVGVRHLSLRGIEGARLRPARLLLVAAGLATWALNTAHALFVRRHLGVAAYDSLAPLLLICWAEVGPWFLRQFRAAGISNPSSGARRGRTTEVPTGAAAAEHEASGVRVRSTGAPRPPGRAAAEAVAGRPPAEARQVRAVAGEQALVDRARALNGAHWQAHGRQISRDKLRAGLGIGATRAERLLAILAAEQPNSGPPPSAPTPASAPAAAGRPDHWAVLRTQPADGRPPRDGDHG